MSKPITKPELIADIAERAHFTRAEAGAALSAVIDAISGHLADGNTVTLPGLAKFEIRERPARKVRNIATGGMMDKGADRAVRISPLSKIKAAVNGGE